MLESKGCNGTDKPKSSHHSKSKQFPCLFSSSAYFTFQCGGFVNVTSERLAVYCKGQIVLEA